MYSLSNKIVSYYWLFFSIWYRAHYFDVIRILMIRYMVLWYVVFLLTKLLSQSFPWIQEQLWVRLPYCWTLLHIMWLWYASSALYSWYSMLVLFVLTSRIFLWWSQGQRSSILFRGSHRIDPSDASMVVLCMLMILFFQNYTHAVSYELLCLLIISLLFYVLVYYRQWKPLCGLYRDLYMRIFLLFFIMLLCRSLVTYFLL